MRIQAKMFGIVLCALAAAACGDNGDGSGGAAGTGGTGGTGGTAGTGGTGGAQTSTVTGAVVTLNFAEAPVEGATVEVFGQPISSTTNASGQFALENVPNGEVFFVVQADGNWGSVDFYDVPEETEGLEILLFVTPDSDVAEMANALGRTFDEADGAVDMYFYEGAASGETGTISAPSDPPFTFAVDGSPVVQNTIIAVAGEGDLMFTSVKTADGPITADVTGAAGVTICDVDESLGTTYPIVAKAFTVVYAYCEPAP